MNSKASYAEPNPSKYFHFTAVTQKDVIGKIDFEAIEECLNQELTLGDYGEAVIKARMALSWQFSFDNLNEQVRYLKSNFLK